MCIWYRAGHERETLDEKELKSVKQMINISLTVPHTLLVLRAAPTMDDYNVFMCVDVCLQSLHKLPLAFKRI